MACSRACGPGRLAPARAAALAAAAAAMPLEYATAAAAAALASTWSRPAARTSSPSRSAM